MIAGRFSTVPGLCSDLPHRFCCPNRTSFLAGLAGSAGPATASPTFFPGLVPKPPRETRSPALAVLRCASARLVRDRAPPA